MAGYGQFCPVAKAMEILDERWTMLVLRELLAGSTHFNEIRRGNPRMSPALLSKRLHSLERAGLVRRVGPEGRSGYELTESGQALRPAIEAVGAWGLRFIGELGDRDLDPHLLFWDIRRTVPLHPWPPGRTVVRFDLDDVPPRAAHWWLVVEGAEADVCDTDPGHEVAVTVAGSLRALVEVWRGDRGWAESLRTSRLVVSGPRQTVARVPGWIGQMALAEAASPGGAGP